MIIAIDFDGTCVDHRYPEVGPSLHGAVNILQSLTYKGHKLVLWTMRSGKELQDAVDWFYGHNIQLFGINRNPEQDTWTSSPKAYAQLYIDDAALGAPLHQLAFMKRPGVDWAQVEEYLLRENIL